MKPSSWKKNWTIDKIPKNIFLLFVFFFFVVPIFVVYYLRSNDEDRKGLFDFIEAHFTDDI